jgi:hypothetical protein
MIYFILLLIEVFFLFLLSRLVSKALSRFVSINVLSLIFLPGVIVHELSHLLMATILFVPVGEMEFIPKKIENEVKLGSVGIARTDPIRRSLIGFAPVFMGLVIIVGVIYLFISNIVFLQNQNQYVYASMILLLIYLLFAVSNTMFSSSKDVEGTLEVLITLSVVFVIMYILGFRPSLSGLDVIFTNRFIGIIQKSTMILSVPIIMDLLILGLIRLFINKRRSQNG